ncbi:hypothetical protein QOZ80_2AG0138100 [Eleusine coracana subsp. coracana]|nr:hypothetical protein QOZ80_2AG0138100 [Eleusine coracana subsp. coracana]
MARTTRSAATERAYLQFAPPPPRLGGGVPGEEFDESDIWGAFSPAPPPDPTPAEPPRVRPVPAGRKAKAPVAGRAAAHGSLPVNIPDWSKILGDEYRGHAAAGEWDVEDGDDDDVVGSGGAVMMVPPHELAWRRRAASLSVYEAAGGVGRTLKVRDAVWKRTTGFQD